MENIQTITMVNIAIAVILLIFLYDGYRKGFLRKLLSIISFFVIGFAAWWLSNPISKLFMIYPKELVLMKGTGLEQLLYDQFNRIAIFLLLYVILQILVSIILGGVIRMLENMEVVSTMNHLAGALLGGVQGILGLALLAMVLRLPFFSLQEIVDGSLLRYSDVVMEKVVFYSEAPLAQLDALQGYLRDAAELNEDQIASLKEWLLSQNVEEESVETFIDSLR